MYNVIYAFSSSLHFPLGTCPYDLAWAGKAYDVDTAHVLTECSSMGLCDRDLGICRCFEGFEGEACQRCKYIFHVAASANIYRSY